MEILGRNINLRSLFIKPTPSVVTENRVLPKTDVPIVDPEKGALPIAGGRSSQSEYGGLFSGVTGQHTVPRLIPKEFIEAIEHLSMTHPDFSHAIDNICDLAATNYHITFDAAIPDKTQKQARLHLENKAKGWYLFGDGSNGLITDLLRQCCNAGCVSAEIVPQKNLRSVQKVVLVAPASIEFLYNKDKDQYVPHQRPKTTQVTQNLIANLGLIELNTVTYKYFAMYRINDHPYAIPPFLAALENTNIGKELLGNLKWVAKNMGILGVISLFTSPPALSPGETFDSESYQTKCLNWLQKWRAEAEAGLKNGIIVGFKGNHEVQVSPSHVSANGAKDIWNMNDIQMVSGLKQDGVLLNRDQKTSEAFAKVAFEILKSRVAAFQKNVAAFLCELYRIELQLAGFPIDTVKVKFDPVALADIKLEAEAEKLKIENVRVKYQMGIISQEQAAQELGYETAAEDAPRGVETGVRNEEEKKKDKEDKKSQKKKNSLTGSLSDLILFHQNKPMFDYYSEETAQLTKLTVVSLDDDQMKFDDPSMDSLYNQYTKNINRKYKKTVNEALDELEESLKSVAVELTADELVNKVLFHLYATFQTNFGGRIRGVIENYIEKGYRKFREDKSIFGKKEVKDVDFALPDHRALTYFKASDELYLGKFITDPDTRKRLTTFIKDTYLRDGQAISHNPKAIAGFRAELGDVVIGENWKIDRVVSTTVNKLRNYAAVNYMQQVDVKEFEIRGVNDSKQCAYCKGMQGKRFSVTTVSEKIQEIVSREPEFVADDSPFITSVFKDPSVIADMSSSDLLLRGVSIPPYHCHCRDLVIAVME